MREDDWLNGCFTGMFHPWHVPITRGSGDVSSRGLLIVLVVVVVGWVVRGKEGRGKIEFADFFDMVE